MRRIADVAQLVAGVLLVVAVLSACRPARTEPARFGERGHDPETCAACNSPIARVDPARPLPRDYGAHLVACRPCRDAWLTPGAAPLTAPPPCPADRAGD